LHLERFNLPKDFPSNLLNASYLLESIGINDIAWKWDDALQAITFLCEKDYAILGGDVYKIEDADFVPALDNWYLNKDPLATWKQYVTNSQKKAISYIKWYREAYGNDFYYVLVYDTEDGYNNLKVQFDKRI
jgi:hypothetical protein